uniref:NADH dehydrogenase subunit 2 n=1 Tax=Isoetes engelmannii TaxID=37427 RepID=G0Y665_ISOEN|nr:NADH dehydrogenase subunit 2 [Isoetes engelmannii]
MFEHDFLGLFPEILLTNTTLILLIYGVVFSTYEKYDYPPLVRNVGWLGLLSVLITILLVAADTPMTAFQNTIIKDDLTYYGQIFLLLCMASTIVMCLDFKLSCSNVFETIVLIFFSTCSMLLMISANDLMVMYLAIELQSLCFYVIAASRRDSEFSTEAGLKYFILGAFSSGILLFGCSMIYGLTGVTDFEELAKIFAGYEITLFSAQSSGLFLGILFIAVGFLFKITAVPFHMWAPDVYEGSPTMVTAFFSIAPKIAILANMLRVFLYSFHDSTWQPFFYFCSIASMILGALAAMAQNKVKRLLAYSSIGHVGYLCIGFSCGSIEGIQSLLIGLSIYVLMTINVFAIVLTLRQKHNRFKYIADLGALAKTNPLLTLTLSITMFSYAGIPPLAGFCSKFYLFFAALGCGAHSLALIGVVTSVISCFYYIRLVKIMYFDTPKIWILYEPMDREKSLLLAITLFLLTLFFLYPSPLFLVTHKMALSLCL